MKVILYVHLKAPKKKCNQNALSNVGKRAIGAKRGNTCYQSTDGPCLILVFLLIGKVYPEWVSHAVVLTKSKLNLVYIRLIKSRLKL